MKNRLTQAAPLKPSSKPSFRAYAVFASVALFLLYEMALRVSPGVMAQELMRDLNIKAAGFGILGGAYYYALVLMQIPVGLFFDRYSMRMLITTTAFISFIGAMIFSYTDSSLLAYLSRFLMGIGSAFAYVGILVVSIRWFPRRYFAFLVGVTQLLGTLGAVVGISAMAEMVHHIGWRDSIFSLGLLGILVVVLSFFIIRNAKGKSSNVDDDQVYKIKHSLKIILKEPQTWWIALYSFFVWAPIPIFAEVWGVQFISMLYEMPSKDSADVVVTVWISVGIVSPFIGVLSHYLKRRKIITSCCALLGLFSTAILIYVDSLPLLVSFVLLIGFGIAASGHVIGFALVEDNTRPKQLGAALGFNNMVGALGGAFFPTLAGILLGLNWSGRYLEGVPVYTLIDYRAALVIVPICYFLGFIVSQFLIRETHCQQRYAGN